MRKQPAHYYGRRFTIALGLFLTCFFLYALMNPAHAKTKDLLQFTSGSHVIGFSPDSMRLASGAHMLKVDFIGGNKVAPASKEGVAEGKTQPLTKVTYPNIWDGVDIAYEKGKTSIVKSTYTVSSGKKPSSIRLGYNRPLKLDEKGNLVITYDTGRMTESKPLAWQVIEGQKKPVMVAYNLYSDHELGFTVGDYDKSVPLVIDPDLTWNTFLGGTGTDQGTGIAVDLSGNIYVVGYSSAAWDITTTYTAGYDAFVAKLNEADGRLLWNTFLGGSADDKGYAVALDSIGNVYVAGESYGAWGASPKNPYTAYDAFVAKLSATDGTLLWNTFVGGSDGGETAYAIALDSSGNIYLAGNSNATWGSPKRLYTGGADAFVAKLAADGTYLWHTFLGGSATDYGNAIALDSSGNAYVTGYSGAAWAEIPKRDYSGSNYDAFVAKLAADGTYLWHTFLGGTGSASTQGTGIALDLSANIYVAGPSQGAWGENPKRSFTSGSTYDAFVAKLDIDGNFLWHTFLGGNKADYGYAIAVSSSGIVWVAGRSSAKWESPTRAYTSGVDAFVAKLAADGTYLSNTFLGGSGTDWGTAIAVSSSGNAYVAGYSTVSWGDTTYTRAYTSGNDALVAKLTPNVGLSILTAGGSGTITSSPSGINCGSTCSASFVEGTSVSLTATPDHGYSFAGWSGACTGTGACHIIMTHDLTATATFSALPTHAITASVEGGHGTVSVSPSAGWVYEGDTATITMTPDTGYHLLSLIDNDQPITTTARAVGKKAVKTKPVSAKKVLKSKKSGPAKLTAIPNPYVIENVTSAHDITVTYEVDLHTLTVTKSGTGEGTISAQGLTCAGDNCSGTYPYGTTVVISATAEAKENLLGFTGCYTHTDDTCTVKMTSDVTVTAQFSNPCTYTITQTEKDFTYKGGSFNVTVKGKGAKSCSNPSVSSSDETWITASLASFRNTMGTVKVTVPPNNTIAKKDGFVTIEGIQFAVHQAPAPCTLTISSSNDTQTATAGTDSFTVTATTGCAWSTEVDPAASWLTTTSTGNGNGSVSYNVSLNDTSKQRTGKITVFFNDATKVKKVFTVKQSVCTLSIFPTKDSFTTEGGTDSFTVTATPTCPWTAEVDSKSTSWLSTATGAGSVTYTVQANSDKKQRTGKITVHLNAIPAQKKVFTITQSK